jgi:WD40 repeat protein
VAALGVLVLLAASATVLAVQARDTATRQRDDALSKKVANEAIALRVTNPALAAQLSLAAYRLAPTVEARGSLISTLSSPYATRLTGFTSRTKGVSAAQFSPDGHTLATASDDRTMRLWDVSDRHHPSELATLTGHTDSVSSIAFGSNGNIVITASADRTARLWDISDRHHPSELATLTGHTDGIRAVTFNADRNIVATASSDRTVRLWDVTDPRRAAGYVDRPHRRRRGGRVQPWRPHPRDGQRR